MIYSVGDKIRIKTRAWYDAYKDVDGNVHAGRYKFLQNMTGLCGKLLTVIAVSDYSYKISELSNAGITDEMIESDEYLDTEEAIRRLLHGDTLCYMGESVVFKNNDFRYADGSIFNGTFNELYYKAVSILRYMTPTEAAEWADSKASKGYVVRCNKTDWAFPDDFSYLENIDLYERALLKKDFSGIDEQTIGKLLIEE